MVSLVLDEMNSNQRIIATKMISSSDYSFLERFGKVYIKTPNDGLVEFLIYVKSKCNCN